MPQPDGHHRWTEQGQRARRPKAGLVQTCQRCGLKRYADLLDPPRHSPVARFHPGARIWGWKYDVEPGSSELTLKRPPCKIPDKAPSWVPPKMNNVQFTKWLKTLSDKRLKQLVDFLYNEGKRRGWPKHWME